MSAGVPDNEATTIAASAIADMSKRSQAARTAQDFNLGNLAGGSAKRQRVIPPGPISLHSVDTNAHMDIMASNANQMMSAMTSSMSKLADIGEASKQPTLSPFAKRNDRQSKLQEQLNSEVATQARLAELPLFGPDHFLFKASVRRMKMISDEIDALLGITPSNLGNDFDDENDH